MPGNWCYPRPGGYVFDRVFPFIGQQDYLVCNEQICMKLLPEVCLGPMNIPINFVDDPYYDPNP